MIVSNSTLLNILLPKENKVLKEVLKEADSKNLANIKTGNTSVGDILKNLFEDVKAGSKSNNTIENMLKNSNLFKDLGSFSKSLSTLLSQVDSETNLGKFKPQLQSFLKDITNLDEKSLKEALSKSGVFLESKIANQGKSEIIPKNLETILNQVKTVLKDIPTLEAKKIDDVINKILQSSKNISEESVKANPNNQSSINTSTKQVISDLKSMVTSLQNLSQNLTDKPLQNLNQLTSALKDITNKAQLVESKGINQINVPQEKQTILTQTKELLFQLKNEVTLNNTIPNKPAIIKTLDTLIQNNNLFEKSPNTIEPKNLLSQLTNSNEIKNISNTNQNVATIVNQLKTLGGEINTLENKALTNQPIVQEKAVLTQEIKENLSQLKNELTNVKTLDTAALNKVVDKLLNLQNLFTKLELPQDLKTFSQILNPNTTNTNFASNFSSNINQLILTLKETITNNTSNPQAQQIQNTILKTVDKLENIASNINLNNQVFQDKPNISNPMQNDMKTVLLQMQNELEQSSDPKMQETLKQVDKMLMQVDYYQLLSLTSNSNSVYLPFLWDMMEDGSISMKEGEEEKFYCEINLNLKEFGDTSLLLALYDKNKLDLTIYASKDEFKNALRENMTKLKQALNSAELIPMNLKIIDMKEEKKEKEAKPTNIYEQNSNNLGLGLDIRA